MSEDKVKEHLEKWLNDDCWETIINWGKQRGIDILASKGKQKWIIEVKGDGRYPQMQRNFFLNLLGAIILRIKNRDDKYSIALPNSPNYARLWNCLSAEVKKRLSITILFVNKTGNVSERN